MKKVLIAVDYDPTAQKVATKGYALAKAMNAEVTLLHVIADPTYYATTQYDPIMGFTNFNPSEFLNIVDVDGLKKAALNYLDKLKQHLGDETIQTLTEEGGSAEAILKAALDLKADIIVMGTHSRRWLDQILIGSVAEKVLHQTTIPLFIIPTKKPKA